MTFLNNLCTTDDSDLYSALVKTVQNFCTNNMLIQHDDCDMIRLARSENISAEIDKLKLSEQGKRIVSEVFEVHRKAIRNAVIDKIAAGHIGTQLFAFDWCASLVLSNSYNRNLMQPLLKLVLSIGRPNTGYENDAGNNNNNNNNNNETNDPETLSFELTQTELAKFIAKLEEARTELAHGTQA